MNKEATLSEAVVSFRNAHRPPFYFNNNGECVCYDVENTYSKLFKSEYTLNEFQQLVSTDGVILAGFYRTALTVDIQTGSSPTPQQRTTTDQLQSLLEKKQRDGQFKDYLVLVKRPVNSVNWYNFGARNMLALIDGIAFVATHEGKIVRPLTHTVPFTDNHEETEDFITQQLTSLSQKMQNKKLSTWI